MERPISVPIGRAVGVIGQGSDTDQAMSYFLVSQTSISRGHHDQEGIDLGHHCRDGAIRLWPPRRK